MPVLGALLFGLAVAADGTGAVRVSVSANGLAVAAQRAPLGAVLEEIGRQSGTSVTYDGAAPATRLTCDFVAATPGEAFVRALEGLGLNYVLYGGTADVPRVLLISGQAALARTSAAAAAIATSPLPMVEAAPEPDASEEEALTLATPPDSGAVPPRFRRRGEGDGSEVRESGAGLTGSAGMTEPIERPVPPPPRQAGEGDRQRPRGPNGAGRRPN
jgi:hypothetical protein